MIYYANAPGTNVNKKAQEKRYLEFCEWVELEPFPTNEWQLIIYATYLSLSFSSVDSIKLYCGTVCELHKMNSLTPIRRGWLYAKALQGICRPLQHKVRQAEPLTTDLLMQMVEHVNINDQMELASWVAILLGFFLFLHKSNLVPVTKQHDELHQISRSDITYFDEVLIVYLKWSKTNQFGEKILPVPVVWEYSIICLVKWLLFMVKRIPALPIHNLFSYQDEQGAVQLVTYTDLTNYLRALLSRAGIPNVERFSSHSMHRGGCSHAFNCKINEKTIMLLGSWASDAYKRYICVTLESHLKARYQMSKY